MFDHGVVVRKVVVLAGKEKKLIEGYATPLMQILWGV